MVDVAVSDLPKAWRGVVVIGTLVLIGAAGALGLTALVDDRARAQATVTTHEILAKDIEQFKEEAKAAAEVAARQGAETAVREAVGPLSSTLIDVDKRQTRHEAMDDQRVTDLQRRVYSLERRQR